MPELPEVETVRLAMEKYLVGRRVVEIQIRKDKVWQGEPEIVINKKINSVERVGKYLFVVMEEGVGLAIHLKMTGRMVLAKEPSDISELELDYEEAPHTRVVMRLDRGGSLYYWDTRMFGYVMAKTSIRDWLSKVQKKLGPEPWDISEKEFLMKLKKTSRPIKEVILDQHILAGVGNIYANDSLWLSRIDPRRKASSLNKKEASILLSSIQKVMERGLELGGASDNTFRNFEGGRGGYQNEFLVYGRTKEPCKRCGNTLERVVVGGRGSWVCSHCQV